jgi:hypothetical protein
VGLTVKHQQLARQVGDFAEDHLANSMANFGDSSFVPKGTTLIFDSWVCTANGSGGFDSHLTNLRNQRYLQQLGATTSTISSINYSQPQNRKPLLAARLPFLAATQI